MNEAEPQSPDSVIFELLFMNNEKNITRTGDIEDYDRKKPSLKARAIASALDFTSNLR